MKTLSSICVLAGLIPACMAQGQATIRKSPELAFSIPGQGQRLLSRYRGKVVALEFVLTTCPHCQAASHVMTGMQERYGSHGFQALDVAIDPNADLRVENFARDYHVGFPVGWTTLEQMMAYMGFTDRPLVPQLTLIDRSGNIHYQTPRTGDAESMKPEVISQRIEELLAAGKPSAAGRAHHAGRDGM